VWPLDDPREGAGPDAPRFVGGLIGSGNFSRPTPPPGRSRPLNCQRGLRWSFPLRNGPRSAGRRSRNRHNRQATRKVEGAERVHERHRLAPSVEPFADGPSRPSGGPFPCIRRPGSKKQTERSSWRSEQPPAAPAVRPLQEETGSTGGTKGSAEATRSRGRGTVFFQPAQVRMAGGTRTGTHHNHDFRARRSSLSAQFFPLPWV